MATSDEEIPEAEFEFFVYEDDADDPRFSFWVQHGDSGMCLYDRPPEGAGMWLKPARDSDYEAVAPSDELKEAIDSIMDGGIFAEDLPELEPYEMHFFQVIHGTAEESPDAIPDPVWDFIKRCTFDDY